ncbi:MAG: Arm DNA-binding domain-containing protein [Bacteroidota bacterium]
METFALRFYIKREKTRHDGTAPIYARITVNGKRAEIALKRYILPTHWDSQKGKPIARKGKEKELLAYMDTIRNKIYQHHRNFIDREEPITAKLLKEAFLGKSARNQHTVQIGKSKKYYYLFVRTKKPMPTSRRLLTSVGLPKP